ncbi:hypothetical protein Pcac1_g2452 [Phytophthora cactorum]|uniref:Uncharacterized protein n=1 Tax=Phytophthora cactorum TaxID=29920 RepID=A0A329SRD9_9STRA|nr:hypothetical protein Pcac1_g2452 [Phytophthora cactorum]KAG2935479.1 hypothetical protein PC114_g471 [Phytophthora cactorum]KAG3042404.1 hypothetical protein PC119_g122 [Phytophthora cactorum]KAG3189773.1 hypothetical protein C6341_g2054 [Phytophthora cactorum]RAW38298.1 hypothetical protein PC110_g5498 [Phytophthora cactorum]
MDGSWNAFVENFNRDGDARAYRARITAAQQRFETSSRCHMIDRLHYEAMEAGIPCALPFGTACPHCQLGTERLSERDLTGYTTVRVPAQLRDLRVQLERRDERHDTYGVAALVQTLRLHPVLGFPTIRSTIQRVEPRASRSGGGEGGKIPSVRVDGDSRALYDRVAALEQFQSAELFCPLLQEQRY